jgi:uncharacterized protein (TIGR03066 family)
VDDTQTLFLEESSMRLLRFALLGSLLFCFTACSKKTVDTSEYKNLIQGKWQVTEGELSGVNIKGAEVEGKNEKLKVTMLYGDTKKTFEGTYKLDGETLSIHVKLAAGDEDDHTFTIETLNNQELVLKEEKENNRTLRCKRVQ